MRCTVFCMFGTNLSLRVHASSSKDKLNLAINFSYSRLTETKLILLPLYYSNLPPIYPKLSSASSSIKMCLAIVNNKPWVSCREADFKINEAKWSGEEKNSPHSSFLTLQSDLVSRSHKFVDRWKAKMVKCQKLDCEACLNQPVHRLIRGSLSLQKT